MARLIRNKHNLQLWARILGRFEPLFDALDESFGQSTLARAWKSNDSDEGHDEKLMKMDCSAISKRMRRFQVCAGPNQSTRLRV